MTPPEGFHQIKNYVDVNFGNRPARHLLVLYMMLSMVVATMAIGYTFADLEKQLKHLDEIEAWAIGSDGLAILTSIFVIVNSITGSWSLFKNDIKKLNGYAGGVFYSLILQMLCTFDKASNLTVPACQMTQGFSQNTKELGLVEQRWIWDGIQSNHGCCGLNSPNDYLSMNESIPVSCCPKAYACSNERARKLMYKYCIQTTAYYKNGCLLKVLETQNYEMAILVVGASILIGVQLGGMLLALCIARSHQIKRKTVNPTPSAPL